MSSSAYLVPAMASMVLLNGYALTMQVRPGGKVSIKRLS